MVKRILPLKVTDQIGAMFDEEDNIVSEIERMRGGARTTKQRDLQLITDLLIKEKWA